MPPAAVCRCDIDGPMTDQNHGVTEADLVREELVAYLDGELDGKSCQRVEQRLAEDEPYRRRMQQLDDTWRLLENLPQTEVDESFTHSTTEMIAMAATEDLAKTRTAAARNRLLSRSSLGGMLLVAALVGYSVIASIAARPNRRLRADLPVIEGIDIYRNIDSVELLRRLDEKGLFDEEGDADSPQVDQKSIQDMTADEKQQLSRKKERFYWLAPEKQQQMRKIQQTIAADSDGSDLHRVLVRHHEWLKTLSPGVRAELLDLAPDERIMQIGMIQVQQESRRLRELAADTPLTQQDIKGIRAWLDRLAQRHRPQFKERLRNEGRRRDRAATLDDPRQRRWFMIRRFLRPWKEGKPAPLLNEAADIDLFRGRLSAKARDALDMVADPEEKRILMYTWVRAAFFFGKMPKVSNAELEAFAKTLSQRERQDLEGLPDRQLFERLRWRYYKQRNDQPRGHPARGRRGPPPPGGRRPPQQGI